MTDRSTDSQVDRLFVDRWSPRAFDGSQLSETDLNALFEAARWAPSAFNAQPWRLLYAVPGDANWDRFLTLLVPANQAWAKNASLLVFFVSAATSRGKPSHTHSFDTGSAWMSLALQAQIMGLHAHGMSGVDFDAARVELGVPDDFRIEAAAAVGRQTDVSVLPEALRDKEVPSDRKPIAEVAFAGNFVA
ncbi:nitroreductase family protein [Sphingomonas sp. SRS2]|uniref:nitroreductase family protein n=1 Tax=Sphingomonas sp. SRS2 TaxID=133190 RepID=UPI0006184849|nr:nitroreductase family protein [Sphingomonas sp. SRS2]KKC27500.1 nitroreductase [Sphingomonas sp. SRS2]